MIVSSDDEVWLRENYPGLSLDEGCVSGTIIFRAKYDKALNRFVRLPVDSADGPESDALHCRYRIRIGEPTKGATSELPALRVEGIPDTPDRHCSGGIACLCSPFEEEEFLRPVLQLRAFLERLVIPYLYGQEFFSKNGRWPWAEYSHGVTGLLESYAGVEGADVASCLQKLSTTPEWKQLRALLQQREIGGHTLCLCPKRDQFRRCHGLALQGLRRLHQAIRHRSLRLP